MLFCGRDLKCFSPLRGAKSKTTHYLLVYISQFKILKDTAKAPAVELKKMNKQRDTKTAFLTP